MTLSALTERKSIVSAVQSLREGLTAETTTFDRNIGFHGGSVAGKVHWRREDGYWFYLKYVQSNNRYWCCYGCQDPNVDRNLGITVEMNILREGYSRRLGGALAADEAGSIYLVHSGKVGGGRAGIGKSKFLNYALGAEIHPVRWPDGIVTDMILVAGIGEERLPQQIANYVQTARDFKESIDPQKGGVATGGSKPTYFPEFEGIRKKYSIRTAIQGVCDHGTVVRFLKQDLDHRGNKAHNDQHRDLYLTDTKGHMTTLFEVKTDYGLSTIYEGIGQLLFNCARESGHHNRVLVLPKFTSREIKRCISKTGVNLLEYGWKGKTPVFYELEPLMTNAGK